MDARISISESSPNPARATECARSAALDAHHLARSIGFATRGSVLWNECGQRLGVVPFGRALDDGTVSQTIKRTRLSRALADEATRRGVRVEYAKRLAEATTTPDGRVVARFTDGSEAPGDLLVGADGVHSVTRQLVDPNAPAPCYVGLVNFGGYTPDAGVLAEREVWHMVFGRRAFSATTWIRAAARSDSSTSRASR